MKRKRRLQSISTLQLPTNIRTTMNNIRNFITRSTNNINTVRFRNARSNTTSNISTMESSPVFANPMFGATTSLSNEPAKLNVEVHPPSSKPTRKAAPSSPPSQQQFDPQRKETDHDKANLVVRSSSYA